MRGALKTPCLHQGLDVKMLPWFRHALPIAAQVFEHLWMQLCKNGKNLIFHSLNDNDSMGCIS